MTIKNGFHTLDKIFEALNADGNITQVSPKFHADGEMWQISITVWPPGHDSETHSFLRKMGHDCLWTFEFTE